MMKKLLFSVALAAFALGSNAQALVPAQVTKAQKAEVQKRTLAVKPGNFSNMSSTKKAAPMKSPSSGVGFARPEGVYYSEYQFGSDGTMSALFVPSVYEIKYKHYCSVVPTWSINGEEVTSDYLDEDNNLLMSYPVVLPDDENGYAGFYAPTLTAKKGLKKETFTLTDIAMVGGGDFMPITTTNLANTKMYTGFQDGPAYGTNSVLEGAIVEQVAGAQPFAIYQAFEKPVTPMYVSNLHAMYWTEQEDALAGKELTAKVYLMGYEGEEKAIDLEKPDYTLKCKELEQMGEFSDGGAWYGQATFYNLVEDEIFGEMDEPFVIDQECFVLIEGYQEEGVDVRFFLCDQGDDANELPYARPTRIGTVVPAEEGEGTELAFYYWANIEKGYCYCMSMGWDVLYDVINIPEQTASMHISDDGQSSWTEGTIAESEEDFGVVYMLSSFPWTGTDDVNYEFKGCPDWLHLEVIESYYTGEETAGINLINPTADPLPADVKGRCATVIVTSIKGAKSAVMTFAQGEVETGINTVNASAKSSVIYNLAGQKVNMNYKGVTIENGVKVIR